MKQLVVEFDKKMFKALCVICNECTTPIDALLPRIATWYTRTPEERDAINEEYRKTQREADEKRYGKMPDIKLRTDGKILQFGQMGGYENDKNN